MKHSLLPALECPPSAAGSKLCHNESIERAWLAGASLSTLIASEVKP